MASQANVSPVNGIITLVLGVVAVVLVFFVLTGRQAPVVGNGGGALLALGIIGLAMCTLGGIGPTQAAFGWKHPLTIAGSVLGMAALLVVILPLLGVKLPLIVDTRSAVLALAVIIAVKVVLTGIGRLIV